MVPRKSKDVAPDDYNHTYHAFRSITYNESSFETIPSSSEIINAL